MRNHNRLLVMSDEIYEFLISTDKTHYSLSAIAPDLKERIFKRTKNINSKLSFIIWDININFFSTITNTYQSQ